MKIFKTILVGFIISLSHSANAGGLIADALKDIGAINAETARSLDAAHKSIKQAIPVYGSLEQTGSINTRKIIKDAQEKAQKDAEAITRSVLDAEKKLNEVNQKLVQVKVLSEKIESERDQLAKDKIELEGRERLFSMGFYTSLAATVLAGFGLFVRLPTSKLERKLKALEIEHKEIVLSQLKKATI